MESPMMPVNIVFQVQHRHTLHQPDTSPKRTNKKRSGSKHERFLLYFAPNWTSELSMIFQKSQKMSKAKKSTRRLGHNMPQQLKKQEKKSKTSNDQPHLVKGSKMKPIETTTESAGTLAAKVSLPASVSVATV